MKVNANNFYQTTKIPHYKPEEVAAKDIDMDFQFTPVSGGANQETVYPQVLVAIDYDTYEWVSISNFMHLPWRRSLTRLLDSVSFCSSKDLHETFAFFHEQIAQQ